MPEEGNPEEKLQPLKPPEEPEEPDPIEEWQEELLRQVKRARAATVLHTKFELVENVYPLMEMLCAKLMEYITDAYERLEELEDAVFEEEGAGEGADTEVGKADKAEEGKAAAAAILPAFEQLTAKAAEIDVVFKKLDAVLPQEGEARVVYSELMQKMQEMQQTQLVEKK